LEDYVKVAPKESVKALYDLMLRDDRKEVDERFDRLHDEEERLLKKRRIAMCRIQPIYK